MTNGRATNGGADSGGAVTDASGSSWLGLSDARVLVTGGGSGIGREVALAFARVGAEVALLDLDAGGAHRTAELVADLTGVVPLVLPTDISQEGDVDAVFSAVRSDWGSVDVLANVAGVLRAGSLDALPLTDWNLTLDVDLTGAFLVSRAARRLMTRGGSIVHVASIAGSEPQINSGAYSAAKAGLIMLSRQMAAEWGSGGVRSNVVSPGLVRTPMTEAFYEVPGVLSARESVVPLRRAAAPADIADVVLFLASTRSSYVTGQELVIDGGYSQTLMSHVPRPGFDAG